MNALATDPTPQEQAHTYANGVNLKIVATAVQITGSINDMLLNSAVPTWFKTAVDIGAIQESLTGQITLTMPKGDTTFDLCPQAGEWLVRTNIGTATEGFDVLTDATFKYLYKRVPVEGDYIFAHFAHGAPKGTPIIEQVTKVMYVDRRTPICIHTAQRIHSSPLRGLWRFAEAKEIQAQAHEASIAYKKFWGEESDAPIGFTQNEDGSYTSDGSDLSRNELIDIIRTQHKEIQNLKHLLASMKTD